MKTLLLLSITVLFSTGKVFSQDCKTSVELDTLPRKYLTAAEYPWPEARAEYFNGMVTAADKQMAKQTLAQLEKMEQQSHAGFSLTGGNWENYYSTEGYGYIGGSKLGKYTFQSSLHEYFCNKGKLSRNSEASTILKVYVNDIPLNTLNRFLHTSYGTAMGDYDFGLQYADWKNYKSADVNAQLISLLTYVTCNSQPLLEAINSGNGYFQDIPEKEIKPNNRNNYVYRYWFIKKIDLQVLLPVSRKEYLQSLLEYYEREKLYFPKLLEKLAQEHDKGITRYNNWLADVNDKIAVVQKTLAEQTEEWLSAQAIINRTEDASQTYKANLTEKTNYNRFWKFYENEKQSEPLYKYNAAYFKLVKDGAARPQIISVVLRYVTMPSSLRLLNNFTKNFDFNAVKKLVE